MFLLSPSADSIKKGAYGFLNSCSVRNCECTRPVQVGTPHSDDIIWTSPDSQAFVGNPSFYGLADNGKWTDNRQGFVGLNAPSGFMTFTFTEALDSVGGFINYAPYSDALITALVPYS